MQSYKVKIPVSVIAEEYVTIPGSVNEPIPNISTEYLSLAEGRMFNVPILNKVYWVYTNPETNEQTPIRPTDYIVQTHLWNERPIYSIVPKKLFESLYEIL